MAKQARKPPQVPIGKALGRIHDGDLGILRPTTAEGRWITRIGRARESHVLAFYWRRGGKGGKTLWIVEQIAPEGRTVPAKPYLLACPSETFTVYRVRKELRFDAKRAVEWALVNIPGVEYDEKGLWRSALSHMPYIRWYLKPSEDDEANGNGPQPLYCSAAMSRMARAGGVDLVPGLADRWTEPVDIRRSAALVPVLTITHSGGAKHGTTT